MMTENSTPAVIAMSWLLAAALVVVPLGRPNAQPVLDTATATAGALEIGDDLELHVPEASTPTWKSGWFWGVGSAVTVIGVVVALALARSGSSCFCLTPEGTPCDSCN